MKNNPSSALDVCDYIINIQTEEYGLNISHLKLQKLLFYCQAFNLVDGVGPLFKEDIVAWPYGPVVVEAYDKYRVYGNSVIPFADPGNQKMPDDPKISAAGISTISSVMEAYGSLSAISLMERTHKEAPWMDAFSKGNGTVISHASMKKYYKKFLN